MSESKTGTQVSLKGEKPKLKGSYRCPYCKNILIPIENLVFTPLERGKELQEKGYNFVCVKCMKAYERESLEQSDYVCAKCGNDVVEVSYKDMTLYYCKKCRALYDKDELKKEIEKEEVNPQRKCEFRKVCYYVKPDCKLSTCGYYAVVKQSHTT